MRSRSCSRFGSFNPRTREGCDSETGAQQEDGKFQSTHPRGVRLTACHLPPSAQAGFNPRTREGCDQATVAPEVYVRQFQSTHPRGVRPPPLTPLGKYTLFQSTHPRGVRLNSIVTVDYCFVVSIHAPARGATHSPYATCKCEL